MTIDHQGLAYRILMREESFADAVANHCYVAAVQVLGVGEKAALAEGGIKQPQVVRRNADEQGIKHVLALVPGGDRRQAKVSHFAKEFHRDGFRGWGLL